jgi:hypothetical protein
MQQSVRCGSSRQSTRPKGRGHEFRVTVHEGQIVDGHGLSYEIWDEFVRVNIAPIDIRSAPSTTAASGWPMAHGPRDPVVAPQLYEPPQSELIVSLREDWICSPSELRCRSPLGSSGVPGSGGRTSRSCQISRRIRLEG